MSIITFNINGPKKDVVRMDENKLFSDYERYMLYINI